MTHGEFIRAYPEYRGFPELITGADGRRVRLMDATYADYRCYMALLERRIARKKRRDHKRGLSTP